MSTNLKLASITSLGGTTRTLESRFSNVKNVKDFGAVGDLNHDDTPNIQAAIDYVTSPFSYENRGEIFFPPGNYLVTEPVTFNDPGGGNNALDSIIFRGVGAASRIQGNFNDFLLRRNTQLDTPANNLTGGTKIVEGLKFVNGHATGGGLHFASVQAGVVRNCTFAAHFGLYMGHNQSGRCESCLFSGGGDQAGSYGILFGESTTVLNCDFSGLDVGAQFSGGGCAIMGCRFEVNKVGISTESGACFISNLTMESNETAIDIALGTSGATFANIAMIGFPGAFRGGNPQYGIRTRGNLGQATFMNINSGVSADIAGVSLEGGDFPSNVVFINVSITNGAGPAWLYTNHRAHAFKFINCTDFNPTYTFTELPGQAGGGAGGAPYAGETYYITDGNQATVGGNVTAGGGSNKSWVTYDGTNWKRGV